MGLADLLGETSQGPGAAPQAGQTNPGDRDISEGDNAQNAAAANLASYNQPGANNMGPYATAGQDQSDYQANQGLAGQARGQQNSALGLLQAAALGQQPSAAQIQMQQGTQQSIQAQMAMANSARGGAQNAALAQRNALMSGAQMQQANVGQTAQLRAGEMATAQQAYMQGASGMRGQDLTQQGTNLQSQGMSENMAIQQGQLQTQQNQMNNAQQLGMYGLSNQSSLGQLGANTANQALNQQNNQYNATANAAAINGAIGAAGSMAMMSDERLKEDVRPAGDADRFLASLHPATYRYKDPSNEPTSSPTGGRYLGIMAQDVERSPTGSTIVKDTPRGKALEGGSLMSALAAGLGRVHERLSAVEGRH